MSHGNRFLFKNGVVSPAADTPSVAAFLEANAGAYTTTRTHNNGSEILFWQRHLRRLSSSLNLLLKDNPKLVFRTPDIPSARLPGLSNRGMIRDSVIRCLVNDSLRKMMPFVVNERRFGEELAITALLSGNVEGLEYKKGGFDEEIKSKALDVYLHVGGYVPPVFGVRENAAHLAVVSRGRDFASAKYSNWVRLRKCLDKRRPPLVTELLLSNDGERILEGCLTNFVVVCMKEKPGNGNNINHTDLQNLKCIEVQTAPVSDGVLPGILRQVMIDICLEIGIPFREVAPSWSECELWTEAFITNSLRTLQHVETIQAPSAWDSIESKTWEDIMWVEKRFEGALGKFTSILQWGVHSQCAIGIQRLQNQTNLTSKQHEEVLQRADGEAFPVNLV